MPGLLSAVIIVGGILSGVFTATESSAIAVVYTVLVAALVYRSLDWPKFLAATRNAVRTTAIVMLIISTASAFGWLMAVAEVPLRMSEALLGISENPLLLLLIVNLMLLILGTFMDMAPLIIITTPIFLPVATQLGMDPVQFGVVMILNLGIGLVTPAGGLGAVCRLRGGRHFDRAEPALHLALLHRHDLRAAAGNRFSAPLPCVAGPVRVGTGRLASNRGKTALPHRPGSPHRGQTH